VCTMVGVKRAGVVVEMCDTVQELADALGVAPATVSPDAPDVCLCNARLDALGARKATDADGWPYPEYIIERPGLPDGPTHSSGSIEG
jgi:hypothetical protein